MTPEDLLVALEEIESQVELDHKEEKRDLRLNWCKSALLVWWWGDDKTWRMGRYHCNDWRHCEICFGRRVKKFSDRVERAESQGHNVVAASLLYTTAKKVTRKIGKANYMRIPTGDSTVLLIVSDSTAVDGESLVSLPSLDWEGLIRDMPINSRISGDLGKKEKVEYDDYVVVPTIAIENLTYAEIIEANKAVVDSTPQPEPKDAETLQFQLDELHEAFVKLAESMGARIIQVGWKRLGCNFTSDVSSEEKTLNDTERAMDELFNP